MKNSAVKLTAERDRLRPQQGHRQPRCPAWECLQEWASLWRPPVPSKPRWRRSGRKECTSGKLPLLSSEKGERQNRRIVGSGTTNVIAEDGEPRACVTIRMFLARGQSAIAKHCNKSWTLEHISCTLHLLMGAVGVFRCTPLSKQFHLSCQGQAPSAAAHHGKSSTVNPQPEKARLSKTAFAASIAIMLPEMSRASSGSKCDVISVETLGPCGCLPFCMYVFALQD